MSFFLPAAADSFFAPVTYALIRSLRKKSSPFLPEEKKSRAKISYQRTCKHFRKNPAGTVSVCSQARKAIFLRRNDRNTKRSLTKYHSKQKPLTWLFASEQRVGNTILKGGDPAAGSPTATLLRLHPNHRPYRRRLPLLPVSSPTSGKTNFRGVTGGVYKARERIHPGMLIQNY